MLAQKSQNLPLPTRIYCEEIRSRLLCSYCCTAVSYCTCLSLRMCPCWVSGFKCEFKTLGIVIFFHWVLSSSFCTHRTTFHGACQSQVTFSSFVRTNLLPFDSYSKNKLKLSQVNIGFKFILQHEPKIQIINFA